MTSSKKDNFEDIYKEIESAVQKMESGDLSLSQNMEMYEETTKKIKKAKKMLEQMEGKVQDISKNNS